LHIALTPGQRHEMTMAPTLLQHASGKVFIGDTGYDSSALIEAIRDKGMRPVIHCKPERKLKRPLRKKHYRKRYLVEVFFHHLKRFRAIATRYDKTARNYLSLIHLACATLWLEN
jgi:transposase